MSKAPSWFDCDRGDECHPQFALRQATDADRTYTERLYIETMEPLLERLDALDKPELVAHFRRGFELGESWIVTVRGRDAGWVQVHESDTDLNLSQIHLEHPHRNRGIGAALVSQLQAYARALGKSLSLSVVRTNRAIVLYRRLGFEVVGKDQTKLHLAWRDRLADGRCADDGQHRPLASSTPARER